MTSKATTTTTKTGQRHKGINNQNNEIISHAVVLADFHHNKKTFNKPIKDKRHHDPSLPPSTFTFLLCSQEKSMSYKSLSTRAAMTNSIEDFLTRACSSSSPSALSRLSPSEKSGSLRERRPKTSHYLDVPCQVLYRRGGRGSQMYSAVSDTQLPSCSSAGSAAGGSVRPSFHQSFGGLGADPKSAEWDRRFFQIQQEMDACLQDREGEEEMSAMKTSVSHTGIREEGQPKLHRPSAPCSLRVRSQDGHKSWSRKLAVSRSLPTTPDKRREAVHTSDSDNDTNTSASSASDIITIRLHPPNTPRATPAADTPHNNSASDSVTETTLLPSLVVSSEADNTQDDSDVLNTNDDSTATEGILKRGGKHKRLLKARFRNTLRASARPMFKHLLSKKTASNERKASKVLGIIFLVFVILWTPFFIANILSVTCSSCMTGMTNEMMSVFVWMGYVASLANPIIYTMFNTAFRRTFIHILTCRIERSRRMKFSDLPTFPSVTTTMPPSERRGTMTILLDHRT